MNDARIKYHLKMKALVEDGNNLKNILMTKLAVIEDIISGLRRDKGLIRKKLEKNEITKEAGEDK
jgi:hypothetical protein